ncbi:MAG: UDP-N-acetylmuramate dehydrogenase [Acidiferrobacterales bacterium]
MTADDRGHLRGKLAVNEPMSRHTSWRVGGPADRYYIPADVSDLQLFLSTLSPNESIHWLGLGSNLLVRDAGVRGTVIATTAALNGLQAIGSERVRAEAGVPTAKVARFTVERGLSGAQFLAGIPGTIGGALAMNAGAFGGEMWNIVERVETVDRQGCVRQRPRADFRTSYRRVEGLDGEWFIAAHLLLGQGDRASGRARIKSLLAKRGQTQPTQIPNAGSVFKNPPDDHAARLIDTTGLKGLREGNACVSEHHANFIVNEGAATAADIERLINKIRQRVAQVQGITLELEVRIIGEADKET